MTSFPATILDDVIMATGSGNTTTIGSQSSPQSLDDIIPGSTSTDVDVLFTSWLMRSDIADAVH